VHPSAYQPVCNALLCSVQATTMSSPPAQPAPLMETSSSAGSMISTESLFSTHSNETSTAVSLSKDEGLQILAQRMKVLRPDYAKSGINLAVRVASTSHQLLTSTYRMECQKHIFPPHYIAQNPYLPVSHPMARVQLFSLTSSMPLARNHSRAHLV
jgi:hypothetical protein